MTVGYGKKIRERVAEIHRKTTKRYVCPSCSRSSVKRTSFGVWECKKCKAKFASGAYEFTQ